MSNILQAVDCTHHAIDDGLDRRSSYMLYLRERFWNDSERRESPPACLSLILEQSESQVDHGLLGENATAP